MKNLLIFLLLLTTSCSVIDPNDFKPELLEKNINVADTLKKSAKNNVVKTIIQPDNVPDYIVDPISPGTSPQTVYKTSIQNQEWNVGWYNQMKDFYTYGGTSHEFFLVGSAYFDYDRDGDFDLFVTLEYDEYPCGEDCGWPLRGSQYKNLVLVNHGINNEGRIEWEPVSDAIDVQPRRIYRRIVPADLNNDGHIDIIAFNAEDPEEKNDYRIMGGIDVYWNSGDGYLVFEEIVPYQEGMETYFHGGTVADVNNDGWVDIIGGSGGPYIYLNNQGNFTPEYFNPIEEMTRWDVFDLFSVESIDINNDGYTDLIMGTSKKPWQSMYYDYYTIEDFANHTEILYGKPEYPYFNSTPDVILKSEIGLSDTTNYKNNYCCVMDYSIVDYDEDGDLDIFAVSMRDNNPDEYNMFISYHENIGDSSFVDNSSKIFGSGQSYLNSLSLIKTWDIDNDGFKEVLIENTDKNGFNVWKVRDDGLLYQTTIKQ